MEFTGTLMVYQLSTPIYLKTVMAQYPGRALALAKFLNFTMQYSDVFYGCQSSFILSHQSATISEVIDWVKNPVATSVYRSVQSHFLAAQMIQRKNHKCTDATIYSLDDGLCVSGSRATNCTSNGLTITTCRTCPSSYTVGEPCT